MVRRSAVNGRPADDFRLPPRELATCCGWGLRYGRGAFAAMSQSIPSQARVVVVGGGIAGCSVAYHLAQMGWRDVVVLEQGALAGGTTWHAAGLVGRLRTSNSLTTINKYSAELYPRLEQETGHSIGWKQVGSLIVAKSEDRMIQLRRTMAMAELFGVESHLISAREAQERWPLLQVDDILGAGWLPHDGKCIPKEVTLALAKGAQAHGARVIEGIRVLDILTEKGRAVGVRAVAVRAAAVPVPSPAQRPPPATVACRAPSPGPRPPVPSVHVLPPEYQGAFARAASRASSREPSWTQGNCWRCDKPQGLNEGWCCDHDDEDGRPCRQVLCGECWPHGVTIPLFCREHRGARRRPRDADGKEAWSSSSAPPERCDGTSAADRIRRHRDRARRADEADREAEVRRAVLGNAGASGAAAGAAAPRDNG